MVVVGGGIGFGVCVCVGVFVDLFCASVCVVAYANICVYACLCWSFVGSRFGDSVCLGVCVVVCMRV